MVGRYGSIRAAGDWSDRGIYDDEGADDEGAAGKTDGCVLKFGAHEYSHAGQRFFTGPAFRATA